MLKNFVLNIYNFFFNYPTPGNLITMWNYGVMSFIFLVLQVITGLFLSMYYSPHEAFAFVSVESVIMRDVTFGWFFRYMHSNGASFFLLVYIYICFVVCTIFLILNLV